MREAIACLVVFGLSSGLVLLVLSSDGRGIVNELRSDEGDRPRSWRARLRNPFTVLVTAFVMVAAFCVAVLAGSNSMVAAVVFMVVTGCISLGLAAAVDYRHPDIRYPVVLYSVFAIALTAMAVWSQL